MKLRIILLAGVFALLAGFAWSPSVWADEPEGEAVEALALDGISSMPPVIPGITSIDRIGCFFDGAAASWRDASLQYTISGADLYTSDVSRVISSAFSEWTRAGTGQTFSRIRGGTPGDINVIVYPEVDDLFGPGVLALTFTDCINGRDGIESADIYVGVSITSLMLNLTELQNVMTHEIGHALGLGHSNNSNDLMFPGMDLHVSSSRIICPSNLDIVALASRAGLISVPSFLLREGSC